MDWIIRVSMRAMYGAADSACKEMTRLSKCGCPSCLKEKQKLFESWSRFVNVSKRIVYKGEGLK